MSEAAIKHLAELGEEYVCEVSGDSNLYEQWRVASHSQSNPYNDGTCLTTATSLINIGAETPAKIWLDEPLFGWNGSTTSPEFSARYNPTINTTECSALSTVGIACAILDGTIPAEPVLKDCLLKRIGATFFAGASSRMLMDGVASEVGFICKDDSEPNIHSVSEPIFFGTVAMRSIVAFDLHDTAHHAAQIRQWPDFYAQLGQLAESAFTVKDKEHSSLYKSLAILLSDATFEESILENNGELHSFGCLNWLSPRSTPAAEVQQTLGKTEDEFRLLHKWHMLFALKDLYRTQSEARKKLGIDLNWLDTLGYHADPEFVRISEQRTNTPLVDLDIAAAYDFTIHAPETADELFANAQKLLKQYAIN